MKRDLFDAMEWPLTIVTAFLVALLAGYQAWQLITGN